MNRIASIITAALMLFITMPASMTPAFAAEAKTVKVFEDGSEGYFEFNPFGEGDSFVVWIQAPGAEGGRTGSLFGQITAETKITIANRAITRENLDLLNNQRVLVYGKFRKIGRGEGSKRTCLELTIYVLPSTQQH